MHLTDVDDVKTIYFKLHDEVFFWSDLMWTLWLPFLNNLWYPLFILMGPGVCGFYYLGNETDKYVNEYWHNPSIYIVVKESNLPKGHSLPNHLSQTCLDRENSMANPSKFMKAHWNFGASKKKTRLRNQGKMKIDMY